jgi:hypothetical protein
MIELFNFQIDLKGMWKNLYFKKVLKYPIKILFNS